MSRTKNVLVKLKREDAEFLLNHLAELYEGLESTKRESPWSDRIEIELQVIDRIKTAVYKVLRWGQDDIPF